MSPLAAAALVFTSSGAVLALEILAGRLLAPYVGVTLESYTGIIGVILAGIATGSWLGGRIADRRDPHGLLGPILTFGGATALLTIPIVDYLGQNMRGARPATVVVLALCGFVVPAAILSAVTPVVVKIQLRDLDATGRVVGRLSAVGTFGALFGTFVTGFVLIAALPTRPVIRGIGFALVALGAAVWLWMARRRDVVDRPGVGVMGVAVLAGLASFGQSNPCEYESAYFCAFVQHDPDDASGRILWLDTLRHSYVDLDDPTHLEFSYARTMSDVLATIAPEGQPLEVVHIGGGGLSLPRYLDATRPGTHSTVLEIDPLLTTIAEDELGYEPVPSIDIVNGDARLNIDGVPTTARTWSSATPSAGSRCHGTSPRASSSCRCARPSPRAAGTRSTSSTTRPSASPAPRSPPSRTCSATSPCSRRRAGWRARRAGTSSSSPPPIGSRRLRCWSATRPVATTRRAWTATATPRHRICRTRSSLDRPRC